MSLPLILFFVLAVMAVKRGAVLLILPRELIHSALALVMVMVSLAVLYLLLGAEFIAAVQIIVYAGAVMVLFVFVIMLLNTGTEERTHISKIATWLGLPLAFFLLLEIAHIFWRGRMSAPMGSGAGAPYEAASTHDLSMALFQQYLFPFEAISILILIALLGALVLAEKGRIGMIPISYYLMLSAILFGLGRGGVRVWRATSSPSLCPSS